MPAREAPECPMLRHLYLTPFDPQRHALHQCLGHLPSGLGHDPAESLARYVHPLGGLFLIQPLQIGESNRLYLIDPEDDLTESRYRHSGGLEQHAARGARYPTTTFWSWHGLRFTDNLIMSICP